MGSVELSEFSGPEVPLSGLGMWSVSWKHKSSKASRNHKKQLQKSLLACQGVLPWQ